MLELIYLIAGLAGLVLAAHLIINGALHIAERLKLSQMFVGLTILAIGTDLPELMVSIAGATHRRLGMETSGLVVGNAIGSNFGQIALTLGILGLLGGTIAIKRRILRRDGLMMIFSVLLLGLVSIDGAISVFDGLIFLVVYLVYFFSIAREETVYKRVDGWVKSRAVWAAVSLLAGFAILAYCSNLVIENAIALSQAWGVPQSLLGILVLGIGTSLPELVVSLTAIRRNKIGLGVGNLIGSNIFDILVVLGIGSAISGFVVSRRLLYFDIPFLLFTSLAVVFFFRKDRKLIKWESAALIGLFLLYATLKLFGF